MILERIRIGGRLGLAFGAMLAMLGSTLLLSTLVAAGAQKQMAQGFTAANDKVVLVTSMRASLYETVIATHSLGMQTDVLRMHGDEEKIKAQRLRYREFDDKLASYGLSPSEKNIQHEIAALDIKVDAALQQAIGFALSFNNDNVVQIFADQIDPLNQQRLKSINRLVELQQAAVHNIIERNIAAGDKNMRVVFACGVITVLLGMAGALLITRSITKPLRRAVAIAKTVAAGDLRQHIQSNGNDEISELLTALAEMNANLYFAIAEVRQGSDTIAIAAGEIASGNLDLSSRTEAQASSLEQTAAAMAELISAVKKNTANTGQANQLAMSASEIARKGGMAMIQVIDTMDSIDASAKKITEITAVIDGIAFQTNILALNAAVEAARAGEQGRGFAVVAAEVRLLAQRSAAAAKEIKSLIDDSERKVSAGVTYVDHANGTMDELVQSIRQVVDIMGDIDAASKEQTSGIEQINQAIMEMDAITQQNAALVEEAAAAAASLQNQTTALTKVVGIFQIDAAHSQESNRQDPPAVAARLSVGNVDTGSVLPDLFTIDSHRT